MRQRQHLREFQEARAEDDRGSPAPPRRKRGRPSNAEKVWRSQLLTRPPERSAVLQLLLRTMDEEALKLKLAGY
jgi:hypothetical protein